MVVRAFTSAFTGSGHLSEREGAALVLTSGVVFSVTAIAVRAVEDATAWQILAYRGLSTVAAMVLLIRVRRRSIPVRLADTTWRTVFAGMVLASSSILYVLALQRTSVATTLFMLAAGPIFAAVIGWLVLREAVPWATKVAIALTVVGISVMVGSGLEAGSGIGVLLALILPLTTGVYNVVMRADTGSDPIVPALVSGLTISAVSGVVALATDGLSISLRDLALACVMGGGALGIGLPLFNLGHKSVTATKVSLLMMTEVVLAPLWVWIWPGETPAGGTLLGGAIVLGTVVWLVSRSSAH